MKNKMMTGLLCAAALAGGQAEAAEVYAYVHSTVAASSDTLVSVPVNNAVEVELATTGVTGTVLNVANSPSFVAGDYNAGAFAKYYVRFVSGPAAGLWASVTVNSETSITIDNAAVAALASSGGGDTIRVYKHHTVASVFPEALLDEAFVDGTQLLFYSTADAQNKAPGSGGIVNYTSFFDIGWGANAERPINPEESFVIRNNSGSTLSYVATGIAPDHDVAYLIEPGVNKDTPLSTGFPVDVTVEETGLGTADGRLILLQTASQNALPGSSAIYVFTTLGGVGWGANAGTALLPNTGFILRQQASDAGGKATVVKPY